MPLPTHSEYEEAVFSSRFSVSDRTASTICSVLIIMKNCVRCVVCQLQQLHNPLMRSLHWKNPFEDIILNIDFIVITGLTKPQLNVHTFQMEKKKTGPMKLERIQECSRGILSEDMCNSTVEKHTFLLLHVPYNNVGPPADAPPKSWSRKIQASSGSPFKNCEFNVVFSFCLLNNKKSIKYIWHLRIHKQNCNSFDSILKVIIGTRFLLGIRGKVERKNVCPFENWRIFHSFEKKIHPKNDVIVAYKRERLRTFNS